MPRDYLDAIESDIQALVWQKDASFSASEIGSHEAEFRRWIKDASQHGSRQGTPGLGVLNWKNHVG